MSIFEPQFAQAIKEFNARLGDELSIKPGDTIEIIADDREFNDGWYMGKNLNSNMAGLYPKSFTKPAQNPNNRELHRKQSNDSSLLRSRSRNRQSLSSPLNSPIPSASPQSHFNNSNQNFNGGSTRSSTSSRLSSPNINKYNNSVNSSQNNNITGLINNQRSNSGKFSSFDEEHVKQSSSGNHRSSHSSVIRTMSEIDQALEDFRPNEYEEDNLSQKSYGNQNFASKSILDWDSQDVGDYFKSLNYNTEAVQFQRHKITGNILLELELAYLKELDIGPFGTRFEIFKIIENLKNKVNNGTPILEPRQMNSRAASKRVSGTGITIKNTKQPFDKPNPVVQQQPPAANNYANEYAALAAPDVSDYKIGDGYTMDNPYLNLSTDNFSGSEPVSTQPQHEDKEEEEQQQQQEDNYSMSSNSELMPSIPVQDSKSVISNDAPSSIADQRKSIQQKPGYANNNVATSPPTSGSQVSKYNLSSAGSPVFSQAQQQSQSEERQFSPVRKAPLPPGGSSPPKSKQSTTEIYSNSSPSTPNASRNNSSKLGYIPFSAGSRIPDSPIFQPPEEEFSKLNLINEQQEELSTNSSTSSSTAAINQPISSPKYRSASANEASSKSPTAKHNFNPKRAVSSAVDSRPPLDNSVGSSESSFKVNQVRNAQTSKVVKKTKKQTSAFQEGINRVTPEMSAKTAEHSGWMSKKSSSTVGTWKQRFFTLHGTRLSYFGNLKDTKEKGLIDITAHRVLPAREDDKLVSLYAATTGQGRFCFKLVPPAPGSKKGLTFTQPKVHYFAVETREEMRNWMSALMKATIDVDETVPTVSTCSTPTVSLAKAQELLLKARENAKAREEQLKAKGFLQPGVNPNNVESSSTTPLSSPPIAGDQITSPNLEIMGMVDNNRGTLSSSESSMFGGGGAGDGNNNGMMVSPKPEEGRSTKFGRFLKS
ncbi:Boi2 protein [Saccharomycopsis crataegensis]|uniref:Boi2 protein n=1 Tax=Saccharomycopsis crataegensis TaxID=43959 RepID=A0AAV5QJ77_9ASCO|nr:Boi2 protein [Saccharomycopsis crataegensis]